MLGAVRKCDTLLEDGSGVAFSHPTNLREGPLGEGTIRLVRSDEMRHRGLREFSKVVW